MKNNRSPSGTRDTILKAAGRVVVQQGVSALTLEAAAREAGVSKGGLLYHFPTKEALIQGMLAKQVQQFEKLIEQMADEDDLAPQGKWVRAFVRATFETDPHENTVLIGLLAALATNPELLAPLQAAYQRWDARMQRDGIDPTVALAIRMATDGLLISNFFGLNPPGEPARTRVMAALLELTRKES